MEENCKGSPDYVYKFIDEYSVYVETESFKEGWDRWCVSNYNIVNKERIKQLTGNYKWIEVIYSQTKYYYLIENESGKGLLSSTIKELLPIEYLSIDVDKNSDIIRTKKKGNTSNDTVVEYFDSNGKLLRSILFQRQFSNDGSFNLAWDDIRYEFTMFYNGHCTVNCRGYKGILDLDGRYIIPPIYDSLKIIDNERVIACRKSKFGLITFNEKVILDFLYDRLEYFENDFFIVRKKNREGVLNLLCPDKTKFKKLEYDYYSEGTVIVRNGLEDMEKFGVEDSEGNIIVPISYDYISQFKNGVAIARIGYKSGIINKQGNFVQSMMFDHISRCKNDFFITEVNNRFGLLKADSSVLLKPKYSKIEIQDNTFLVEKRNTYNYMDFNGKFLDKDWSSYDYDDSYTREELDDMYRGAFDGFDDASWNID